jgi:type III pantothenate kinase
MLLLFDIGNTHVHVGLADSRGVRRHVDLPTSLFGRTSIASARLVRRFIGRSPITGVALCSVVPQATAHVVRLGRQLSGRPPLILSPRTVIGVGIHYPNPNTIGPDRLANAVAVRHHHGAPAVVVDFGTAVTFDVVDAHGDYVGGIIAPGLAAMTDYLHEKTALLPRIRIRETRRVIGKNTRQAMLIGAVHGYRGLIRELVHKLKKVLGARKLPVVATGGYARLMAARLPEITRVDPLLTLEGLRLVWEARSSLQNPRPSGNTRHR